MLAVRLGPPRRRGLDDVQAGREPDPDLADRVEDQLVPRRGRDQLVELDVQRAPARAGLLVLLVLQELAEPGDVGVGDPLRCQGGRERLNRGAVLEELAQLLGFAPQPLDGELGGRRPDERAAVAASPDLDVLLLLQPAQALPHRHPVDAQPDAELSLAGQPLPGQVLVEADGSEQQVCHLLAESDRLRCLG